MMIPFDELAGPPVSIGKDFLCFILFELWAETDVG